MTLANRVSIKEELYTLWSAQEELLQQYRGMGLTHQSIIAAGALLIITLFNDQWDEYRGIFTGPAVADASLLWPLLIKLVLLVAFVYIGLRGTKSFSSMIRHRGACVNFCQNLLFMAENDALDEFAEENGSIAAFSALMRFAGADPKSAVRSAAPSASRQALALVERMAEGARQDYSSHHFSRRFLNNEVFSVFNIVWIASAVYGAVFVVYLFVPA
jgi:hypothetical protein